ncbi:GNAT family N-acetyltransferase [bacterium]|nr:GNAT family N-acetyltransferase [bacterium]
MNTPKTTQAGPAVVLRPHLKNSDLPAIRTLVEETGMFSYAEIEIAAELVGEFLKQGAISGYRFAVAESEGDVIGYACFGPTPCTVSSYDLYWIAVHPSQQHRGIGKQLLEDAERRIAESGGTRVYADTSGRDAYVPTRAFYERMGYIRVAVLPDFYAPGDAKVIYAKSL